MFPIFQFREKKSGCVISYSFFFKSGPRGGGGGEKIWETVLEKHSEIHKEGRKVLVPLQLGSLNHIISYRNPKQISQLEVI